MQQVEMLRTRYEQADTILDGILRAAKADIAANNGASPTGSKKISPEEYKFQLQAILARTLPVNDLLAVAAEMLYRISESDLPTPSTDENTDTEFGETT